MASESLELVRYEIARIKQRLESMLLLGEYEDIALIAERIIVLEVHARDEGFYDHIRDEILEIKKMIASISTAYRIGLTPKRHRRQRKHSRWLAYEKR